MWPGPVGLAASTLRLPLVLTEADSHLGVTNRLLAPLARRVFLAFPIEGREGPKFEVVGRPVPPGTGHADRAAARARFGVDEDVQCLLVFGGSLGAKRLNEAALAAFGDAAPCAVLHVAGRRDHDDLAARLAALGSPPHYLLHDYVEPFADALAAADLVVARAGGSVLEVAAAGLPSILVPYPHATADHQTANARHMEAAGAAVVVPDDELDGPRLAREVGALLRAPERMGAMAKRRQVGRQARCRGADRGGACSERSQSDPQAPVRPAHPALRAREGGLIARAGRTRQRPVGTVGVEQPRQHPAPGAGGLRRRVARGGPSARPRRGPARSRSRPRPARPAWPRPAARAGRVPAARAGAASRVRGGSSRRSPRPGRTAGRRAGRARRPPGRTPRPPGCPSTPRRARPSTWTPRRSPTARRP